MLTCPPHPVSIHRFNNIVSVIMSCGEYEKMAQGVFENYLNTKIKDSSLYTVSVSNRLIF